MQAIYVKNYDNKRRMAKGRNLHECNISIGGDCNILKRMSVLLPILIEITVIRLFSTAFYTVL